MGPKVDAVCRFVELTGGMAAIGSLDDAVAIVAGSAGTVVTPSGRYREQDRERHESSLVAARPRELDRVAGR